MDFKYSNSNTNSTDILNAAQLITTAFSKTMEDNNCLLMLSIGLHQEIDNTIKDLEDLVDTVTDTNNDLDGETVNTTDDILETISDIIDDLKDKCFQCDLKFPDLDFKTDLSFLLGKLKEQISLYKSIFRVNKLDLCQPAYSMQNACVPDILRLITLLLTAFVSIMTLKKLSNISITAFIKGVLSTLLSKITQSLKVSVNIGSTNIYCLINTLQEIALAIPTQQNIYAKLNEQERVALGLNDSEGNRSDSNLLKSSMLDSLNKTINDETSNLNRIDTELYNAEQQLNDSFTMINNVISLSLDEVNNYIESLISFQTFFECETTRSGMDVEEAISMINNLIQVINMLSSLALSLVKKNLREEACKTPNYISSLSDEDISDLMIKDLISDTNQKIVDIIDSDDNALQVIIRDQEPSTTLPKLDLLDCSIDYFVESHTLPRIIEVAKKQIEEEQRRIVTTGDTTYTFNKPSKEQEEVINNIVDLIYTDPNKEDKTTEELVEETIVNPIGKKGISRILEETIRSDKTQTNLACKSVDDVLSILSNITKK